MGQLGRWGGGWAKKESTMKLIFIDWSIAAAVRLHYELRAQIRARSCTRSATEQGCSWGVCLAGRMAIDEVVSARTSIIPVCFTLLQFRTLSSETAKKVDLSHLSLEPECHSLSSGRKPEGSDKIKAWKQSVFSRGVCFSFTSSSTAGFPRRPGLKFQKITSFCDLIDEKNIYFRVFTLIWENYRGDENELK